MTKGYAGTILRWWGFWSIGDETKYESELKSYTRRLSILLDRHVFTIREVVRLFGVEPFSNVENLSSEEVKKRTIKRNDLIVQKRARYTGCKSKKRYTLPNPTKANEVHQMDNAWTATHQGLRADQRP